MNGPVILVLRGGAIGDFICTVPALASLRMRWPECRIHLVGYPAVLRLARLCGVADTVASLDRSEITAFFVADTEITAFQRQLASSCDIAISYLHDPSGTVCRNLKRAGARQVLYGPPQVAGGHAVDWLMKPLSELDISATGRETAELRIPDTAVERAIQLLPHRQSRRTVFIHPGSGSPAKNWPPCRFAELAERIRQNARWQPVFLAGEADRAAETELRRAQPAIPFLKPADLSELACLLAAGDAYIGNDSGVTHLAAAVGLPVLALFGPSDPGRWAPRNPKVKILQADTMEGLTAADVWDAWLVVKTGYLQTIQQNKG